MEVEVEDPDQLRQTLDVKVDRALLDNFNIEDMKQAVALNNNRIQLEASGNITGETLLQIAETGVDFISIGALTKHLRAIDFSLRFIQDDGTPRPLSTTHRASRIPGQFYPLPFHAGGIQ